MFGFALVSAPVGMVAGSASPAATAVALIRVSASTDGTQANHYSNHPTTSDDGSVVSYRSLASSCTRHDRHT